MNHLQAFFDGISKQHEQTRASTQMTLGKMIDVLEMMDPGTEIDLHGPHSYRGYYSDLAFEVGEPITAAALLKICRDSMGEVFEGYKGGDFVMGRNTPIWVADYGCCGERIMKIKQDGEVITSPEK